MRVGNTYRLENQHLLTGLFKNSRDVFHAQEVLTDFGYPKEAARVIELKDKSKRISVYSKQVIVRAKDRIVLGTSIGAVLILGALMAGGHFYSVLNFSEMAILLTVWILLLVVSAVVCGFIGILVMMLISSALAEEVADFQKDAAEKSDVLISVAARTPDDAKDIAREWVEIGGEVV